MDSAHIAEEEGDEWMKLAYSIFILACAWYDIRTKKIPVWLFAAFGAVGMAGVVIGGNVNAGELFAACLPGILLLLLTFCTRGAAGAGDGCFFLISACYLGFTGTMLLFLYGLLLCGACGLGMAVWGITHGINAGRMRLPFVPFILPVWLWLLFLV